MYIFIDLKRHFFMFNMSELNKDKKVEINTNSSNDVKSFCEYTKIVTNNTADRENGVSSETKYAVLMETSGEECESWYYCIRYDGNENNLKYLNDQLESVDWYILDDLSTFDLDLEHLISEQTAKELTKLELNHHSFHRKFDGILDKVDLRLKKKDKNEKKMVKVFEILGYGQIEDYIDEEDLDEEDLTDNPGSSEDEEDSEVESSSSEEKEKSIINKALPSSLQKSKNPRFALLKQRRAKK